MAIRRNAANGRSPFSIARLNSLRSTNSFQTCNDHLRAYYTHYKAGLIKVIEIAVLDAVLCAHISDLIELRV